MIPLCLHCERAPRAHYLRLCNACAALRGIRRLYEKSADWTPERDARIQALVERAKHRLPLFAAVSPVHSPKEPCHEPPL